MPLGAPRQGRATTGLDSCIHSLACACPAVHVERDRAHLGLDQRHQRHLLQGGQPQLGMHLGRSLALRGSPATPFPS